MSELKQKLESLLFSSGRSMGVEELSRLCRASHGDVEKELKQLQYDYNENQSSVMVVNEGNNWKLTTKEKFLELVKKIVTQTELTKSVMETLAVIAFRYPIKQSDLIKIRSNKAYDHLKQLEELGYISRQKHGRTKLIKLTQKFFDYFDLPPEKLKEKFSDFESIAKAINEKEKDIEKINEEQAKKAEEDKQKREEEKKKIDKEIESVDDEIQIVNLEVIDDKPKIEIEKEKLGDLEVVDEPEEESDVAEDEEGEEKEETEEEPIEEEKEESEEIEEKPEEEEKEEQEEIPEEVSEEETEEKDVVEKEEPEKDEKGGIKTTPEMEEMIDKRVEELTKPEKEETEETEEESTEEKSEGLEPESEAEKKQ